MPVYNRAHVPMFLTQLGLRYIPASLFARPSLTPLPLPDNMHPTLTRILFFLLFSCSLVAAANFTQCLQDFINDPNAVGGVDSKGQPTSPAEAVGLTYEACTARCGTGPETFNWRTFAQLFSAWLLPWLALISQLPFGSGNYVDDFISGKLSFHSSRTLLIT